MKMKSVLFALTVAVRYENEECFIRIDSGRHANRVWRRWFHEYGR